MMTENNVLITSEEHLLDLENQNDVIATVHLGLGDVVEVHFATNESAFENSHLSVVG